MRPFVTIVIPTRNEEAFIGRCLQSIIEGEYPTKSMEVFVVDGVSEDRTADLVRKYQEQHDFINLLFNAHQTTPYALNIGVKRARGDLIIIMGAHAEYPPDYITLCVEHSLRSGAENVGGTIDFRPRRTGLKALALTILKSDKFGVGKSEFRTGVDELQYVDTVFGGC